jgi:hypothetical protein
MPEGDHEDDESDLSDRHLAPISLPSAAIGL